MNSTAALQVNLQAGPMGEWPARVARAYRLGPTLVAIAASSPWLHGRDTGWKSVRQRALERARRAHLRPGAGLRSEERPRHSACQKLPSAAYEQLLAERGRRRPDHDESASPSPSIGRSLPRSPPSRLALLRASPP